MIVTLYAKRCLTVPACLAPASPGDYFDARFGAEEDALVFERLPARRVGSPCSKLAQFEDSYIAAAARWHGLTIATGNDQSSGVLDLRCSIASKS
jgi:hypothetical protein